MRTRKAGKAEGAGEALRKVGGVRKPRGKKGGAVVSKKIVLRSRTAGSSRGASEPEQQQAENEDVEHEFVQERPVDAVDHGLIENVGDHGEVS